ncbi:reverse transcriptase domain-containing protein, partial [Tanacetum coccineum]
LTDNIKGEVTSSKPVDLNAAIRMAHKLMEQNSQARNEIILEGNARAMVTAHTNGKISLYERCFTRHVGQCTIKCHKCGKVGHKARYCREKSVATGANAQPIWTCYDCGKQGHTRNRCPKKVKQEEVREVCGQAYAIKDAELKGPNVVTRTFLLNNRYASVLFYSGFDRSFVKTRFSSLLDIKPIEMKDSYEVELADGRVHDVVIVYGEKVVRISYGNKMLTVEGDKGRSRLKIILCIKARKYVEQGFHLFLAHVMKKKSKEKRMEDVPVIHDFLEVFPEELLRLPPPRKVLFLIDLVSRAAPVTRAPYRLALSEMKELSDEEKHGKHLKIILELLKKKRFGVYVDPAKIEAIKSWAALTTPTEVRQFLILAGYYRRFIEGFSLIFKPLTKLTQKNKKYKWGKEKEEAFQALKQKLCSAPILALPKGTKDFMVYCDVSLKD